MQKFISVDNIDSGVVVEDLKRSDEDDSATMMEGGIQLKSRNLVTQSASRGDDFNATPLSANSNIRSSVMPPSPPTSVDAGAAASPEISSSSTTTPKPAAASRSKAMKEPKSMKSTG